MNSHHLVVRRLLRTTSLILLFIGLVSVMIVRGQEKTSPEGDAPKQTENEDSEKQKQGEDKSGPDQATQNRLGEATSPYLRMHADNPVDWYAWGDAAFNKAKNEDKPIFLSIGYYTCHWCHVMEKKVFMNEAIAEQLNETFVNIKVDREQRPAVDHTYMTAAHRMGRGGGWPLSVFMTPDRKPFYIATYIPPGRMKQLIKRLGTLWEDSEKRKRLIKSAKKISRMMNRSGGGDSDERAVEKKLDKTYDVLTSKYDQEHAGFGSGQKFPSPHNILFLLRYWKRTDRSKARTMATETLNAMRRGGMYDHIGFGFHRYSTDPAWKLPHFEKMLYDQAMLTYAYAEAYQATGNKLYARTAEETIQFVERDLETKDGVYASGLTSGADGEEGAEYIWSTDEVRDVLSDERASLVINVYNMKEKGNYEKESTGEKTGKNVLHRTKTNEELAKKHDMSVNKLRNHLEVARKKMYTYREKQSQMEVDDKVLTDWNGMMIAALAKAGRVLNRDAYLKRARTAARFLLDHMKKENGRLLHRYRNGSAEITGKATDYAYLIWGLVELYQSTFDPKWLQEAIDLSRSFVEHFWDKENSGFYFSADFEDTPMSRQKQVRDGARPSSNSVAMWNFYRIGRITAKTKYQEIARSIGTAFSDRVDSRPTSVTMMMTAMDLIVGPSFEIVIAGDPEARDTRNMLKALWSLYVPRKVVVQRPPGDAPKITELAKYTRRQKPQNGQATAYVCQNYSCKLPTTSIQKMNELLTTDKIGENDENE